MGAQITAAALRSPADSIEQDWNSLADYLLTQQLRLKLNPPPQQFAGGFANLNYLIELDGQPAVLRRPPMGPLPPGAYDMSREARILNRLWQQFPLAPRSIHLCQDASILGAPFQISEYRPGLSIREHLPDGAHNAGAALSRMMIEVLAKLHQVDPARVGLDDLGRPQGFLQRAVAGWLKRADLATDSWANPEIRGLLKTLGEWLQTKQVADQAVNLLHNDFKLDNILLQPATLEPVALLDWDQGTRGDGLFDLATLLSYWTQADDPPELQAMQQMPTPQAGFWTREQAASVYADLTGRDLCDFRFHRVLAQLKTAVIFFQLYLRFRSGETAQTRYADFGNIGQALLLAAHDTAHHGRF